MNTSLGHVIPRRRKHATSIIAEGRVAPALSNCSSLMTVAEHLDRTRSWIINDALDEYVAKQEGLLASIRQSVQEADADPRGGKGCGA